MVPPRAAVAGACARGRAWGRAWWGLDDGARVCKGGGGMEGVPKIKTKPPQRKPDRCRLIHRWTVGRTPVLNTVSDTRAIGGARTCPRSGGTGTTAAPRARWLPCRAAMPRTRTAPAPTGWTGGLQDPVDRSCVHQNCIRIALELHRNCKHQSQFLVFLPSGQIGHTNLIRIQQAYALKAEYGTQPREGGLS